MKQIKVRKPAMIRAKNRNAIGCIGISRIAAALKIAIHTMRTTHPCHVRGGPQPHP
jgi:hypothetical protein